MADFHRSTNLSFYNIFLILLIISSSYSAASPYDQFTEEDVQRSHFPQGFLFGAATSSYQVEGAYLEDGKGVSNWGEIQGGSIGIIANTFMYEPLRDLDLDRHAVARALAFTVAWIFDPLVFGDYPSEMRKYLGNELPRFSSIERDLVKGSIDFIGINHYSSLYVKDCIYSSCGLGSDRPIRGFVYTTGEREGVPIGDPTAMSKFFVVPEGMEKIIKYLKERYGNMPMYVTENGYAPPAEDNEQVKDLLSDHKRIKFHKAYLVALSRAIRNDFIHFAKICFESFGDRVKHWTTFNEPNLLVEMAYIKGWYPPARCSAPFGNCSTGNSDSEPLIAMHNILLSHARAAQIYRQQFKEIQGGSIGIIANTFMYEPLRDLDLDRHAVTRALAFTIAWILDPLVFGDYPSEMRKYLGNELPRFSSIERDQVKGSIDFIGINHYSSLYVKDCIYSSCGLGGSDRPIRGFVYTTGEREGVPIGDPTAMSKFFVVPEGMEKIIKYLKERYGNMPMYVTENGYAPPAEDNEQVKDLLSDHKRIKFHKAYLVALSRAIRNGADVRGYFVWSLMDNFEWIHGYSKRFGLVYVHRESLQRTPKLSFEWYRDFLVNDTKRSVVGKIIKIKGDEPNEPNH